jgi:dienelactone hydrolase
MPRPAHARRGDALARLVAAVGALGVLTVALVVLGRDAPDPAERRPASTPRASSVSARPSLSPTVTSSPSVEPSHVEYPVLVTRFRFMDRHRPVAGVGSDEERTLPTTVWYPDTRGGTATVDAGGDAAFPLVVFAHGFDLFPTAYTRLLRAWARAGYVVAAPVFPRTNPDAAGGLDEADIVNQPGDVSFVVTRLLERSRASAGPLSGLIDGSRIAVAGHSDGGETAMAAAYDTCCRDRRFGAAIVLAGAQLPIADGRYLRAHGPPLFAAQGTADTINPPSRTSLLFDQAPAPKYLLWLHGADHLEPFADASPFERVVERLTTAFLDRYLKDGAETIQVPPAARSAGVATLRSEPAAGPPGG